MSKRSIVSTAALAGAVASALASLATAAPVPLTAAEDLLELIMRRYERASTLVTSNRPVEDWGKLLGDAAAVGAMLDRLLHHGHVLKFGPRSWRTKTDVTAMNAAERSARTAPRAAASRVTSNPSRICGIRMMTTPTRPTPTAVQR